MEILNKCSPRELLDVKKNWLPLYSGELACGLFGISDDYVDSYLSLDEKFMSNKEATFFVRASGDSMEPSIKENDILIVDRSLTVVDKSIVAIFFNTNPICKQLHIKSKDRILHSFNDKYKDILITEDDEVEIFGVVIGLVRDFV